ncbi:hypothetical protein FI667_g8746, partial [Globisporangium splendens]
MAHTIKLLELSTERVPKDVVADVFVYVPWQDNPETNASTATPSLVSTIANIPEDEVATLPEMVAVMV